MLDYIFKNNNFYIFDGKNLIDEFHVSINENSERGTSLLEKMGGRTLKCEYLGEIYSVEASSKIVKNGTGGEMLIAELSQNKTAQVFFWTVFAVCIIGAALTIIKERKMLKTFDNIRCNYEKSADKAVCIQPET